MERNRLKYLDFAKFLAIIFMAAVHVFWKFGSEFEDPFGYVINYVTGAFLAAPVFMVSMGVGFAYTRHDKPEDFVKRGISIMCLGYILNIARFLPFIIYHIATGTMSEILKETCMEFVQGDILAFAGLSMILFGFLRKFNLSQNKVLLIGGIMSVVGSLLPQMMSESIPFNATLGLFVFVDYPEETYMCFPLFTWFIFPAFGYWFVKTFNSTDSYKRFFKLATLPCFIIVLFGCLLEMKYSVLMMESNSNFYNMHIIDAFISICSVIAFFALLDFIGNYLPTKACQFVSKCSDALNIVYMVHWVLINTIIVIITKVCDMEFTNLRASLLSVIIIVVSFYISLCYKNMKKRKGRDGR